MPILRRLLAAAALLLAAAAPALAETRPVEPPTGLVEDPCIGAPAMPASVLHYFQAVFAGAKVSAPPAAELAAYKAAQDAARPRDWPDRCHYRADDARLAMLPAAGRRVVFMGDSITEAWGVADPGFFTHGRVNRGISGQTTAQMLLRFQADVVSLHPAMVHIMAGTNDLAGNTGPVTLRDIEDNIVAMATLARANHIRVLLASVPPAANFPWRPDLVPAPQIRALNAWLRDYAGRIGATYVDYYRLLQTPEGGMQPALTIDGVHPNAAGYRTIMPLAQSLTAGS